MTDQIDLFNNLVPQKPKCNVDQRTLQSVLNHYRNVGFPYVQLSLEEKIEEYQNLVRYKGGVDFHGKTFHSNNTGVTLANYYHPHRYGIPCGNHKTALSVFRHDDLLTRCIKKCIAFSGSIDDSKLRSMISIFSGVQVASNFPPGTAKDIYEHFLPDGGAVWDMSCGFGGRMLAAVACKNIRYIGTDPSTKTFQGLVRMSEDLSQMTPVVNTTLFNHGSEVDLEIKSEAIDFCFTSPPYFNTERYAEEDTQSFKAYPYKDTWILKFIGGTAENCHRVLKRNCFAAINIANVKSFPHLEKETIKEFCNHGFKLHDTFFLAYTMMPGKGKNNKQFESGKKFRIEPIFIFQKI